MHVAKITSRPKNGKAYHSYLVRTSFREDGKVKHHTVANITHLPAPVIELVTQALKGETFLAPSEAIEILRSLPHGHVAAVVGTMSKLGLPALLASRKSPERQRALAMIVQRLLFADSKLALSRAVSHETATSTLGAVLGVTDTTEDEFYAAMDWILGRQSRIEDKLAQRHLEDGVVVLYDLTSSYFEGRTCPLAQLGHPRDGKAGKLQIEIGLLTTKEGCPVAVEVFEGSRADPKTVASQVQKLRSRFGLERVVLVGDRGMLTEARIREDLRPAEGLSWVTALRAPAIRGLVERGDLQLSLFDETDLGEITSPEYPGERLVVCRNPLLAEERARKRESLLQATERVLEKIACATRRKRRPLRGEKEIALRVGRDIGRFKVAKHFTQEITDTSFTYARDEDSVARETALDGIYVIRTDLPQRDLSTDETVETYKSLSRVERAFRCMKTVDLLVRPIHHRLEDRVRAHVFLCMLALYVDWHMRRALAPILFEDHEKEEGRKMRPSPVAKAKRSKAADAKAQEKRTEDDEPVHSFRTLLQDLATVTVNRIRIQGRKDAEFDIQTNPTAGQQHAFNLLGVRQATM